jgi:hypothetical protein
MVEKAKAGYTGGGAVSVFAMLFVGAYIVSIVINTVISVTANGIF